MQTQIVLAVALDKAKLYTLFNGMVFNNFIQARKHTQKMQMLTRSLILQKIT